MPKLVLSKISLICGHNQDNNESVQVADVYYRNIGLIKN